ncbi:MAG TPA: hypothetical protein VF383_04445 [Candidatus Dormibacteraeota bacterium]
MVVDVVILLVIVAIGLALARAWRSRPARAHLAALPSESRARYELAWERIEKRFVDAPKEAVQEADSLLIAILGERGHPLAEDRLPHRFRRARAKLADGISRHRTEDLRQALLDYRVVFGEIVGPQTGEQVADGRRETA